MTLAELLALLPDNSTGQIGADDLRTIVSELYALASTARNAYAFRYQAGSPPVNSGNVRVDAWGSGAAELQISETSNAGLAFPFDAMDASPETTIVLQVSSAQKLVLQVAGPSVDNGNWRAVPVTVESAAGAVPAGNTLMTVSVAVQLP